MNPPPSGQHSLPLETVGADDNADRVATEQAARDELRRRLPELRNRPGCPRGSDEDIVAMSHPPWYTACPNPFIADWLADLDRPGDDDRTDPGPFAADVTEGKGNAFYKAHSYPTKVPHPAIMRFICHYTRPGDVVLDGFAGTGMTGVAAQACANPDPKVKAAIEAELGADSVEWGARRAILGELGPSATFIAAGMNLPIDGDAFDRASQELLGRFEREYGWMYRTNVTVGATPSRRTSTTPSGRRCSPAHTAAARSSSTTSPSTRRPGTCRTSSAARRAVRPSRSAPWSVAWSGSGHSPATASSESSSGQL